MAVLITYDTESGDHGVVGVFDRHPDPDEQMAIIEKYLDEEVHDNTSYAFLNIFELDNTVLSVPEPTPTSRLIERM